MRVRSSLLFSALVAFSLLAKPTFAATLTPMGPAVNAGGRAVAVSIDSRNSNNAIVASESGGLFRTTNGGVSWAHVDSSPVFRMIDVAFAPFDPNIVIATAWADSHVRNNGGILRSADGGLTWQKPATADPTGPGCAARVSAWGIAFEPASPNVYVGTDCGVSISRDGGATWTHVNPFRVRVLSIVAQRGGVVDICGDDGVHHSDDGARSWTNAAATGQACQTPHSIAASPFEPTVLFLAASHGVYESDDQGRTWQSLNAPPPSYLSRDAWLKAVPSLDGTPNDVDLYFGNTDINRANCTSFHGPGLRCASPNWARLPVDHPDVNDMAFGSRSNCPALLASDGGVHISTDCTSFRLVGIPSRGYNALQLYDAAAVTRQTTSDLYAMSQDNGGFASLNDGSSWPGGAGGDEFHLQAPHHSAGTYQVVEVFCGNGCSNAIFDVGLANLTRWPDPPSTQGGNPTLLSGQTFVQAAQPAPVPPNPTTTLYLTQDMGRSWASLASFSEPLASFPAISFSADRHPVVYLALRTGSSNVFGNVLGLSRFALNATRTSATRTDETLFGGSVGYYGLGEGSFYGQMAVFGVDPNDPDHVIAADVQNGVMKVRSRTGWAVDTVLTDLVTAGGTFLFSDRAADHQPLAPPGTELQAHAIAFDPDIPGHVLVGTEAAGIIESLDGGTSWYPIADSQQVTGISGFSFDRVGQALVSTYGRGLWSWRYRTGPIPTFTNCLAGISPCLPGITNCAACREILLLGGGEVSGIFFIGKNVVGIATAGGRAVAFDKDGQSQALPIFVKQAPAGSFGACTGCGDFVKKGGKIRGILIQQGQLRAVVTGFGYLGSKQVATNDLATPKSTLFQWKGAQIHVVGSIPVAPQPTGAQGDTIRVFGQGFCGIDAGSPVELRVGSRLVDGNVKVDAKGSFVASFQISERIGRYRVVASQKCNSGPAMDAEFLVVVPMDKTK